MYRPPDCCNYNCDDVVPESIICYLEGKDYQETLRNAISLGGDTDTMACISGSIAAVKMPIPEELSRYCYEILPPRFKAVIDKFYKEFCQ